MAETKLKPYVLGFRGAADFESTVVEAKNNLTEQGFEIVGEYAPFENAHIIVVTNDELKQIAASTDFGGYGAAQRVSVTKVGEEVQVSSTNPLYMENIYRMKGDLTRVAEHLESAIGHSLDFGSKTGYSADELRNYHYMVFMPYFDDQLKLVEHESYETAIAAVEDGLSKGLGGTSKIFRIDIPGKQQSLFGVSFREGQSADKKVMEVIDTGDLRHTAHLPYELLVSGNTVYALHGKFRIAQSFPDLTMGTFMKISSTPDAIEDSLRKASGGK